MYRQVEDKRKEQVEEEKSRKTKLILTEIETVKHQKQEIQSYVDNLEKDIEKQSNSMASVIKDNSL